MFDSLCHVFFLLQLRGPILRTSISKQLIWIQPRLELTHITSIFCVYVQLLFYSHVQNICYPQRAAFLENDDKMEYAHSVAASVRDTNVKYCLCLSFSYVDYLSTTLNI